RVRLEVSLVDGEMDDRHVAEQTAMAQHELERRPAGNDDRSGRPATPYLSRRYAAKVFSNAAPENAGWSRNSSKTSTGSEEVASVSRRDRNTSALAGTRRSLEKT